MSRLISVGRHAGRFAQSTLLLLFVLCVAGVLAPLAAAAPGDLLWEVEYTSAPSWLSSINVAVAPGGRVYVGGLCNQPNVGFYVVCYKTDGSVAWERSEPLPGTTTRGVTGMAVDGKGGVVLTGYADPYAGPLGWVTCRWTADGTHAYTQTLAIEGAKARGVVCDGAGNAYVAGAVGLDRVAASYADWQVVKYDQTGATVWSRTFNGKAGKRDEAYAIARAADGSVYVTGLSLSATDKGQIVVLRFTSGGRRVWKRAWSNVPSPMGAASYAVAANRDGVVAAGAAADGDGDLHPSLVRYTTAGRLAWAKVYGYAGESRGNFRQVALDANSHVVAVTQWQATPSADADVLAARYRATGKLAWTRARVSTGTDDVHGLAVDRYGNAFVTGSIAPVGPRDCFTWSLNARGGSRWYETRSHTGFAAGNDVALTKTAVYVAGDQGDGGWFLTKYAR
jgi:hypothetical protein